MGKKETEGTKARKMFVQLGMNQKEIAKSLHLGENTVSKWAKEGNWKAARTAYLTSNETILQNGKLAVSNLSDILLDLQKQRAEYAAKGDKQSVAHCDASILSISDAISKTSASINKFEKDNAISLVTYLNVMDRIFRALQQEDPKLHTQTLDFQERHVQEIAKLLG